ncbi:MAG: NAD(P)/FAD-dependent oxidoreductase [Haloferacaceae archaeon]
METVVVGGGIVGLSSAYYLASRGADVTVYEKGSLGGGSTGRSVGGIRTQFSTRVNVELSLASLETWERFAAEFGVDVAFRRTGYLFLAREAATAETFRENVALQRDLGVPVEYLARDDLSTRCGALRTDRFVAGTYCPTDGFADPALALRGYERAARDAGVEIHTGTPVTDVFRDGERVTGVATPDGRHAVDVVVNAAGPWAADVAAMAGLDLPVAPRRRQVLVVDPADPVPEDDPLTIDLDTGLYFRPERDGAALVGGHFGGPDPDADPDAYGTDADLAWTKEALERAADAATYFGPETRVRDGWAGLYAVTPDHHPIVGETVPGLVNAVGFSGHGFQHAPATGCLVAELVHDGAASLVDVSRLAADRFEGGGTADEYNVA